VTACHRASSFLLPTVFDAVGDLVGLLDVLPVERVIVVGNDWGATIAWQMALMRPDLVAGVIAFGVPMMDRPPMPPTRLFERTDDALFYTLYFQEPGQAVREFERDPLATLRKIYYSTSGDAGPRRPGDGTPNPFGMVSRTRGLLHDLPDPLSAPAWLGQSDLQALAAAFGRSGFRGGREWIALSPACPDWSRTCEDRSRSTTPATGYSKSGQTPSMN
jgi:pimeloyl-ACP methyl ester carboxylesterase